MTDPDQGQPMLPGLEPPAAGESSMRRSARRTIVQLEALGYLDDTKAILCDQLLHLADAVDRGTRSGRASAVAMAAAQIIATWEKLVPESAGGGEDSAFAELVAEVRRSAAAPRHDPADT